MNKCGDTCGDKFESTWGHLETKVAPSRNFQAYLAALVPTVNQALTGFWRLMLAGKHKFIRNEEAASPHSALLSVKNPIQSLHKQL